MKFPEGSKKVAKGRGGIAYVDNNCQKGQLRIWLRGKNEPTGPINTVLAGPLLALIGARKKVI